MPAYEAERPSHGSANKSPMGNVTITSKRMRADASELARTPLLASWLKKSISGSPPKVGRVVMATRHEKLER
eukprot:8190-Prymnesium_polylepis.1